MVIGICGGSCSGKSTLAKKIVQHFGNEKALLLDQDSYYLDRSNLSKSDRLKINYDHPDSIEFSLLTKHIKSLIINNPIQKPCYNFVTHTRNKSEIIYPKKIIVLEGILIFSQKKISDLIDLKISLDIDAELRLIRRILRDTEERGRTVKDIINQYLESVKPMHLKYVTPFLNNSDLIFKNNDTDSQIIEIKKLINIK